MLTRIRIDPDWFTPWIRIPLEVKGWFTICTVFSAWKLMQT
jgi:hypothetical protein